jgi:hypothetical protein
LGGILSSVLSFLLIAGLINMFVRSTFLFNVQLVRHSPHGVDIGDGACGYVVRGIV